MNQFSEKYKASSNADLLRIIGNEKDYLPEAIQAAKEELSVRRLSDEDMALGRAELEREDADAENTQNRQKEIQNELKEKTTSVVDYLNPAEDEEEDEKQDDQAPPKIINTISIVFLIISVLQIATQWDMLKSFFANPGWDFGVFMYFFPLIIAPIATILFWLKKPIGWILLCIYLGFGLMGFLWVLFISFDPTYLLGSLFFTGTLWVICQQRIRNVYKISTNTMYLTIIATIVIIAAILCTFFFVL